MKLKTRTAPAALPAPGARAYVVPSPSASGVGHPFTLSGQYVRKLAPSALVQRRGPFLNIGAE
jgi:hypothetical protein